MANALFLSANYLNANSPINANVDMSEIYPFAKTAEDIYIQQVIGTKLYVYLKGVVTDSKASPPTAIGTNDRTLLEYLRDALMWYTIVDALPFLKTKIRNIGLVNQTGDNIQTASETDSEKIENKCLNKANFYMNQVKRYLCEYDELYSEFKCDSWNINPDLITRQNCGIAFSRKKYDYDYIKKYFNE